MKWRFGRGKTKEQWISEGDKFEQEKCYDKALAAYEEALRLDPNDALLYNKKGLILLYRLKRYEEALMIFEQMIRLDPNEITGYFMKSKALIGLKRYEEAQATFKPLDQSIAISGILGVCGALFKDGRFQEALEVCERMIRLNPKNISAYVHKSNILNGFGRYREAHLALEEGLQRVIIPTPDGSSAIVMKRAILPDIVWASGTLIDLGRYQEAIATCEQAIKLAKEAPYDRWFGSAALSDDCALAYSNMGLALGYLGRYKEALDACEWAIHLDPNCAPAYANKSMIFISLQNYQEALYVADEAIRRDPNNALAHLNRRHARDKLGRH